MPDSSFDWTFHDDDDRPVETVDKPRFRPPPIPWRKILAAALVLATVLAIAGLGGFLVGRLQRATTAARADLQTAIDAETWAWQSANRTLFVSSLDQNASTSWRREVERQFEQYGKDIQTVTIRRFRLKSEDMAEVDVDITSKRGLQRETRYYKYIQGQWRRTAPFES